VTCSYLVKKINKIVQLTCVPIRDAKFFEDSDDFFSIIRKDSANFIIGFSFYYRLFIFIIGFSFLL